MSFLLRLKYMFGGNNLSIFRNASWLFADKIGRLGLNFMLTAYIARYLGVELFGLWSYAIAFVALFSFFSTLGIYNLLLRDFVKYPEKRNELFGSSFAIKLLGGFVTLLFSYFIIIISKPDQGLLHTLISIVAIGYVVQAFDVIDFFFQSQLKARWIMLARLISFLIFGLLKLSFVYFDQPLIFFVIAQTGELAASAIILIYFFSKHFGSILKWRVSWETSKLILTQSLPILFAEVAILVYMRIDQIMIGEFLGNDSLGIYSAAVRLSELWYLIPGVICSSVFPSIIEEHSKGGVGYHQRLQRLYDILVWISLGIALVVTIFSHHLVMLVFGPQYIEASSILSIHIWASIFVFVGFASNQQLVVENLTRIIFFRTLFGMIANVVFNLILIPNWGSQGAAFATLISQAMSSFLSSYLFRSTRSIFWMNLRTLNPFRLKKVL